MGMAMSSSMTTEPGSFWPRISSPISLRMIEAKTPNKIPVAKIAALRDERRSRNQKKPTSEPNVPGAKGIRPEPNPWARKRAIFLEIIEVEAAIFPKVNAAREGGQNHGKPNPGGGAG